MTTNYPTHFDFVLLNHSTNAQLTYTVLSLISAALDEQANQHFAPSYGGSYTFRVGASATDRKPNEVAINIADSHPDEPDAEGWHQVNSGVPDIEIALDLTSGLTTGDNSLSSVISHEVCETAGDPGANGWELRADGNLEARETCDRVESLSYPASNGVMLSNFLLPSAWIPGAAGPFDFMGILKNAGDIAPSSYNIIAGPPADETSVFGKSRPRILGKPRPLSLARKFGPYSRSRRRGIQL